MISDGVNPAAPGLPAMTYALLALPVALLFSIAVAELLALAIGIGFIARCVRVRHNPLRHADFALLCAAWLAFNLLVSPFAIEPGASFGRSLPWLRYALLYAAITQWLLVEPRAQCALCGWFAVLIVLVAIDMAVQLATGTSLGGQAISYGERLTGPLDRPGIAAWLAKLGLPALAGLLYLGRAPDARGVRAAAWILGPVLLAAILLSGDRNETVLSLLGALLACGALMSLSRRHALLGAGAALAIVALAVAAVAFEPRIGRRAALLGSELGQFGDTQYGSLFNSAWRMFLEDPLTGVGLKGFRTACETWLAAGEVRYCALHAHNVYLEWLSETGLLGSAGLFAFVGWLGLQCARALAAGGLARVAAALLLAALLVSFFPLSVARSFLSNWPALLTWLSVGVSVALLRTVAREASLSRSLRHRRVPRNLPGSREDA